MYETEGPTSGMIKHRLVLSQRNIQTLKKT